MLGWVIATLSIGGLALWLGWPVDRIEREHFARIQPGMTQAEVEAILGSPTGKEPNDIIICWEGLPESLLVDPHSFPPDKLQQWVGYRHAILIELDERGRVSGRYFGHVNRPEGFFAKLLRRLGL